MNTPTKPFRTPTLIRAKPRLTSQRCRRCGCVFDETAELLLTGPVTGWQFGLGRCPKCWLREGPVKRS